MSESILNDLLSHDRDAFASNGIEVISAGSDYRGWACWSSTFRKKWPIGSEFGLVTVRLNYQIDAPPRSHDSVEIWWRAEIFRTGRESTFAFTENTEIFVDELRRMGMVSVVKGIIEEGERRICSVTGG